MSELLSSVWPRPARAEVGNWIERFGRFSVARSGAAAPAARRWLEEQLGATELDLAADAGEMQIRLRQDPRGGAQAYRLEVGAGRVEIRAASEVGLFYGAITFCQWVHLHRWDEPDSERCRLRELWVEDEPDFPVRGVMLDISRNRVPTLKTTCELVDRLASWKINQLQLYMEHTFAYRGHEAVWSGWSPFTAEEIRQLDSFCRARHIDLVPNQNSFGHLHKWLVHQPYRQLAECPEGIEHPFSESKEPFSLCPLDPGSLELLDDLYGQLLPCFSSPLFNVGLDETLDLGEGRSAKACEERGKGRVYLDFLRRIHERAERHGRRMMFWGDIVLQRPELIPELPADAIALEWGYEAEHPFARDCRRFAEAGLEFYVCPGTSSWHSLAGRLDNALENLAQAARHGLREGSSGYLITDWGDNGHLQPPAVSDPALLAGAGFAWRASSAEEPHDLPLARLLDLHAYGDRAGVSGRAAVELGNAYLETGAPGEGADPINGSVLFFLLLFAHKPVAERRCGGLTPAGLRRALQTVEGANRRLRDALASESDAAEPLARVRRELLWAGEALELSCQLGIPWLEAGLETPVGHLPEAIRQQAMERLRSLQAEFRSLWSERFRPGGMELSVERLERLTRMLKDQDSEPCRRRYP